MMTLFMEDGRGKKDEESVTRKQKMKQVEYLNNGWCVGDFSESLAPTGVSGVRCSRAVRRGP